MRVDILAYYSFKSNLPHDILVIVNVPGTSVTFVGFLERRCGTYDRVLNDVTNTKVDTSAVY